MLARRRPASSPDRGFWYRTRTRAARAQVHVPAPHCRLSVSAWVVQFQSVSASVSASLAWLPWPRSTEPSGHSQNNPAGRPAVLAFRKLHKNLLEIPEGIPSQGKRPVTASLSRLARKDNFRKYVFEFIGLPQRSPRRQQHHRLGYLKKSSDPIPDRSRRPGGIKETILDLHPGQAPLEDLLPPHAISCN